MIKDLKDGDLIKGNYIIKNATKGVTAGGLSYITMTLEDNSGFIEAKKWSVTEDDLDVFKAGNIVHLTGEILLYKDKLQCKVYDGDVVDKNNVNIEDLIVCSKLSEEEVKTKLNYFISSVKNENLHKIVFEIFKKFKKEFISYPAAVSNHHGYMRGLAEHTISMCEIGEFIAKHYDLDHDLLISGCLLHDVGKCIELSGVLGTTYTKEGSLLGHLVIGENLVSSVCKEFNIEGEEVLLLEHLIISHHGKQEFGSPISPATKEALALNFIDDLDAKLKAVDKALDQVEEGEFSGKIFALDNKAFYKAKKVSK